MLKALIVALCVFAVVTWLTRSPRLRRALWILALIVAGYGLLKITGAIEALAPDRTGVL
jgi:hypothetical protein